MNRIWKILAILTALALVSALALAAAAEGPGGTPPGDPPSGSPGGMPPGDPPSGGMGGPGGAPGGGSADFTYAAAVEITAADIQENQVYASDTADESALMIDTADAVEITNPTVIKSGDSDGGDSCNFYGLNAALLVKGGAQAVISGGTVTSDADGANGVFCYGGNGGKNGAEGDGTSVTISGTVITTSGDGSGGIMTTGGGITYASGLTVATNGRSSAPIRTDRGGGTVYVDGGTYVSNGLGSPAVYSTAEIHAANAVLVSNLSEGVCIEGKNSIELTDCSLTADNTRCNGNATFLDTVMIYQSMSGDADSGTSAFTMRGGSLNSLSGHMFHVTNTHAVITLEGAELANEGSGVLLSVCDDGWSGASNIAELNAFGQELSGVILVGSNSSMTLRLMEGSTFTGTFSGEITDSRGTEVSDGIGTVSVALDGTSTWVLTADTGITSFEGDAGNVVGNGFNLTVGGKLLDGIR